ncbi:MAG: formylglycine-generating enzyme family protein [Phycisphaeraceae bacterium]
MCPTKATLAAFAALTLLAISGAQADDFQASSESEMKPYKERLGKHLQFVPIPGGELLMGSPASEKNRGADEGPQVKVKIEPFWMGKYEVTWDDYKAFRDEYPTPEDRKKGLPVIPEGADAVSIPTPIWEQEFRPILNYMGEEGGYPVADLSQFSAKQFTKWLSKKTGRFYRLPTEAEWEYAARAGTKTAYFFGDDPARLGDYAWTFDNSEINQNVKIHADYSAAYRVVGQKKPNPWGLYDIYGNVGEWVIDGYKKDHYAAFAGKTMNYIDVINWASERFPTSIRGGNWNANPEACRSASREPSHRDLQDLDPQLPKSVWWYTNAFHVGFRVVRPLKEPADKEKARYWEANDEHIETVLKENKKGYRKVIEPLKEVAEKKE